MSNKNLLNEGTIRRFMKLAEIGPLSTPFVSRMEEEMGEGYLEEEELEEEADWLDEDADFLEEEDYLHDDAGSGVFEEDLDFLGEADEALPDEGEEVDVDLDEPMAGELPAEEDEEDDEEAAEEEGPDAEGDIKADAAEAMENLADELMSVITDKLQDMVDSGDLEISGEGEPEELDVATAAAPEELDIDAGEEEPGEGGEFDVAGDLGAPGGDEEEVIAEIARRVAKRILASRRK